MEIRCDGLQHVDEHAKLIYTFQLDGLYEGLQTVSVPSRGVDPLAVTGFEQVRLRTVDLMDVHQSVLVHVT